MTPLTTPPHPHVVSLVTVVWYALGTACLIAVILLAFRDRRNTVVRSAERLAKKAAKKK